MPAGFSNELKARRHALRRTSTSLRYHAGLRLALISIVKERRKAGNEKLINLGSAGIIGKITARLLIETAVSVTVSHQL